MLFTAILTRYHKYFMFTKGMIIAYILTFSTLHYLQYSTILTIYNTCNMYKNSTHTSINYYSSLFDIYSSVLGFII